VKVLASKVAGVGESTWFRGTPSSAGGGGYRRKEILRNKVRPPWPEKLAASKARDRRPFMREAAAMACTKVTTPKGVLMRGGPKEEWGEPLPRRGKKEHAPHPKHPSKKGKRPRITGYRRDIC